ncbi:hypothetical protein HAX54_050114, partial [Datura stramonium]|nr:hypothetical protein [Datura stramonium]
GLSWHHGMRTGLEVATHVFMAHAHIVEDPIFDKIVNMPLGERCMHPITPMMGIIAIYVVVKMDIEQRVKDSFDDTLYIPLESSTLQEVMIDEEISTSMDETQSLQDHNYYCANEEKELKIEE